MRSLVGGAVRPATPIRRVTVAARRTRQVAEAARHLGLAVARGDSDAVDRWQGVLATITPPPVRPSWRMGAECGQ